MIPKIIFKFRIFTVIVGISILTGCFGGFKLTKTIYQFNETIPNKYARSLLTWVFIMPYGFAATIDFVFLNTYEFWTGTQLVSPGFSAPSTKIVEKNGTTYRITAANHDLKIEEKAGGHFIQAGRIRYNPKLEVWMLETPEKARVIAEAIDEEQLALFTEDGKTVYYDMRQLKFYE